MQITHHEECDQRNLTKWLEEKLFYTEVMREMSTMEISACDTSREREANSSSSLWVSFRLLYKILVLINVQRGKTDLGSVLVARLGLGKSSVLGLYWTYWMVTSGNTWWNKLLTVWPGNRSEKEEAGFSQSFQGCCSGSLPLGPHLLMFPPALSSTSLGTKPGRCGSLGPVTCPNHSTHV